MFTVTSRRHTSKNNVTEPVLADMSDTKNGVAWGGLLAVVLAIVIYLVAQFIAAQIVGIYPALKNWSSATAETWINNSIFGQFFYYLIAEAITVVSIIGFIRLRKGSLKAIGLKKPKFVDLAYSLSGLLLYLPALFIIVFVIEKIFHQLNTNQQQALGFSTSTSGWPLLLVFISLVVLPPIAEEIMFRGFLYSGLKRSLPKFWAVIITCALFAAPHLLESSSGGVLWEAGVDTFILSLVLIWLREKTGRLYAGMYLHGLKNFIAFLQLYPLIHIH